MFEPIEAKYTPDGDDWKIEVSLLGKTLKGKAAGLIAARDKADQLAERLAAKVSKDEPRTVIHTLDGDAVAFTAAYLSARLGTTAETTATSKVSPPAATV